MNSLNSVIEQLQEVMPEGEIITEQFELDSITYANPLQFAVRTPSCILKPKNPGELKAVVDLANAADLNLAVTSSTGIHRNGGTCSQRDNLLIDLSSWQEIDLVDRRNRVCRIQPGVTYDQLLAELSNQGMTIPTPFARGKGKSVLAAVMDREPTTWPNKQWDSSDPVGSTEFIFGGGEVFRSGAGGGPGSLEQQRKSGGAQKFSSGPSQTDFHRVVQGAQGTLGIVNWITLRTELKPSIQETFLAGSDNLEDLLPFVYDVQRSLLGEQMFIINGTVAALLLAGGDRQLIFSLWDDSPQYLLLQNIAGFERLPEERLAYHSREIRGFAEMHGLQPEEQVGRIQASDLLDSASKPCGEVNWRDGLHGSSISIFFLSTLDRVPEFQRLFFSMVEEHNFPVSDIGVYIQPVVQNHACHIEFILPFNPHDGGETRRVKKAEREIVSRLMVAGAFFSRPYGSAAEIVWEQNPANYQLLKQIKGIFDPKRVLQRGKWGL
jgi:FAD/FMN-containing dehydrogenase